MPLAPEWATNGTKILDMWYLDLICFKGGPMRIEKIYRYPVKGLSAEAMEAVALVLAAAGVAWRWFIQRAPPATKAAVAMRDKIQRLDFFMVYLKSMGSIGCQATRQQLGVL